MMLYHYTDQAGFLGILDSRALWFTDLRFLNDSQEIYYGVREASKAIRSSAPEWLWEHPLGGEALAWTVDSLERLQDTGMAVHAACFCSGGGDLLPQWRGYGADRGFSLGFETTSDEELPGFRLERIHYGNDLVWGRFAKAFEGLKAEHVTRQVLEQVLSEVIDIFADAALFSKSKAFEDEAEYRVVWADRMNDQPRVLVRKGGVFPIPYFPVSLRDLEPLLVLKEVWVGPCSHPHLSQYSAEAALRAAGFDSVAVRRSTVPYRAT